MTGDDDGDGGVSDGPRRRGAGESDGERGAVALDRRGALRAGLAGGGALLAGCSGLPVLSGGGGSDVPYRNWLPAPGTGGDTPTRTGRARAGSRFVAYADLGGLSNVAAATPDYGAFAYRDLRRARAVDRGALGVDPLLAAGNALAILRFEVRYGARPYPFADALLRSGPGHAGTDTPAADGPTATPGPGDTTIGGWLLVGTTFVATGSVDTGAVVAGAGDEFSESGTVGEFTLYGAQGSGPRERPLAFAVRDDAVVVALGRERPRADVLATVRAKTGDGTRLAATDDAVDWAVRTAGAGDLALGSLGRPAEGSPLPVPLTDGTVAVASLDLAPEQATATMALAYADEGGVPATDELRGEVGNTTDSSSVSVDGNRVTVEGTWTA